jgi:hypothetical protein
MAHSFQMIDPSTHRVAIGFQGFSWTCLLFGPFPALFRGHFFGFVGMLAAALVTFGFSGLVFMFTYNKWHYNWLLGQGLRPAGAYAPQAPLNVINVSVGNVGTADYSRNLHVEGDARPDNYLVPEVRAPQIPSRPAPVLIPKR